MTTARQATELAQIAARTRYVLLDFDGPICKIFTDPTASTITARLVEVIDAHGLDTPEQAIEAGPHDVLHYAATVSPQLARAVENSLRALEIEAAATAAPTPGIDELLKACQQTGRTVAVVSNNAAEAVTAYLDRMELRDLVAHVQGRAPANPSLMKPNPYLLDQARTALGAEAAVCALVGDSVSDIEAAQGAGIGSIGYANKPGKHQRLADAHADVVVGTMTEVADTLSAHDIRDW